MCGRYYVDDDTAGEIERVVRAEPVFIIKSGLGVKNHAENTDCRG